MDLSEGMKQLSDSFKDRDWFFDIGFDQYGRVVVYVKYMCHETLHDIPDQCAGKQVLVHFAASKTATREQFTAPKAEDNLPINLLTNFQKAAKDAQAQGIDVGVGQLVDSITDVTEFAEDDLDDLRDELDRLERVCGANILGDIFFEIHDKKNAVTNLSAKFPEVAERLTKLYNEYGFDVLYEELEI